MRIAHVPLVLASMAALPPALAGFPSGPGAPLHRPVDDAAVALVKADREDREAALDRAEAELPPAAVLAALEQRLASHRRELERTGTRRKMERLVESRRTVDGLRARALGLIEDEVRYFTPYRAPQVSAEREAEYRKVQGEIDELIGELREAWADAGAVKLSTALAAAVEDLRWTWGTIESGDGQVQRPEWLAEWWLAVDPELPVVGIGEFAWDRAEADRLAYARAVMRRNEVVGGAAMKDKGRPEAERPAEVELEQVRVTNEYRLLLGRRPLAWHPSLQAATRGHSDYMSRYGVLSHVEERNPEGYDFGKRTRAAGYREAVGENCAYGRSGPADVHEGWAHSPGHHRNIVSAGHTEMASALSGAYWTQNFGRRPVTAKELAEGTAPERRR